MTYPIPSAALDDRLAIVGTAGSGKTYAAGTAVERILHRRDRTIIVDPLGVWWGLRLSQDGNTASAFDVVIFGGPRNCTSPHISELTAEALHYLMEDANG